MHGSCTEIAWRLGLEVARRLHGGRNNAPTNQQRGISDSAENTVDTAAVSSPEVKQETADSAPVPKQPVQRRARPKSVTPPILEAKSVTPPSYVPHLGCLGVRFKPQAHTSVLVYFVDFLHLFFCFFLSPFL